MGDQFLSIIETYDDEKTYIIVECESLPYVEINFDETYIPHDQWINFMIEKILLMHYYLVRRKAYPHIQIKCRTCLQ